MNRGFWESLLDQNFATSLYRAEGRWHTTTDWMASGDGGKPTLCPEPLLAVWIMGWGHMSTPWTQDSRGTAAWASGLWHSRAPRSLPCHCLLEFLIVLLWNLGFNVKSEGTMECKQQHSGHRVGHRGRGIVRKHSVSVSCYDKILQTGGFNSRHSSQLWRLKYRICNV